MVAQIQTDKIANNIINLNKYINDTDGFTFPLRNFDIFYNTNLVIQQCLKLNTNNGSSYRRDFKVSLAALARIGKQIVSISIGIGKSVYDDVCSLQVYQINKSL